MCFSLFEHVAEEKVWTEAERTLLLQSVFMGQAQEAFITLSVKPVVVLRRLFYVLLPWFLRRIDSVSGAGGKVTDNRTLRLLKNSQVL